ncbi:MAG: response regulator [Candidatus Hadarchaeales archaeon]
MAKIMAVDDEPDILSLIKKILERAGHQVITCISGKEFLQKFRMEKPDLVLLDVMMPEMDGWDVYREIRKINRNQKVAFLTALDVPPRIKEGIKQFGAMDYISKPFEPDELVKKIDGFLAKK